MCTWWGVRQAGGLCYALLRLEAKIDNMSLAKRPTEVRLRREMAEEFKKSVMIAQVAEPR